MVRRAYTQRSLVEVLLPDADKLWDPMLRRIATLLDDDDLVDRIADALAAAVVLRLLVLKHLYDWSFDECEREVRGHLVYRAFCRIDGERVPDAKTLIRLAHLLDEAVLKEVLARLVALGRAQYLIRGRRLRVDTTVVETNIHYPTDSSGCSRAPFAGWARPSASGPAVSPGGSSRSPSAAARPAPGRVRRCGSGRGRA